MEINFKSYRTDAFNYESIKHCKEIKLSDQTWGEKVGLLLSDVTVVGKLVEFFGYPKVPLGEIQTQRLRYFWR